MQSTLVFAGPQRHHGAPTLRCDWRTGRIPQPLLLLTTRVWRDCVIAEKLSGNATDAPSGEQCLAIAASLA